MKIRYARESDLAELSDLCMRSKAMWGYGEDFLEACCAELTLTVKDLQDSHVALAEESGKPVGVVQVDVKGGESELLLLFIEPHATRRGIGRVLFNRAVEIARSHKVTQLNIEADPYAAAFYRQMGAYDDGEVPSSTVEGRMLPKLVFEIGI